jgi:hypothetical protein
MSCHVCRVLMVVWVFARATRTGGASSLHTIASALKLLFPHLMCDVNFASVSPETTLVRTTSASAAGAAAELDPSKHPCRLVMALVHGYGHAHSVHVYNIYGHIMVLNCFVGISSDFVLCVYYGPGFPFASTPQLCGLQSSWLIQMALSIWYVLWRRPDEWTWYSDISYAGMCK